MQRTVQATFEGGALHPLEPLVLREHQRVTVTIFDDIADVSLDEVRRRLSGIQGPFSQTIVDERRDR